jgi:methionyl-tRNA formyltransferase
MVRAPANSKVAMVKLFLTGKKGLFTLTGIVDQYGASVVSGVVIGRDPKVLNDYSAEIASLCQTNGIRNEVFPAELDVQFEYVMAAGWQRMIREVDEQSLIVFHDSLLPKYRGFAPLVSALLNREPKVGVTALAGSSEYDRGGIFGQEEVVVGYPTTIEAVVDQVSMAYASLASKILALAIQGQMVPVPQVAEAATYSLWRDEEDYRIDWSLDARDICHFISCVGFPYKGASATVNGRLVRVVRATPLPDVPIENRTPGKVIFMSSGQGPVVVCGLGLLRLDEMQTEEMDSFTLPRFRSRFM